jgi:enediyne biosynthesis protein E4
MASQLELGLHRRDFLRILLSTVALGEVSQLCAAEAGNVPPAYPFSQVGASKSGITWAHTAGKSATKYLPETTGAGCAFLDYDNDGWIDIYLVNSGPCDFYHPVNPLRNALYRNNRDGTFTDVTEKAGVPGGGYGQGVAVGDYNGDGFPDLFITQYGRSILYHNNGDGTFTDVTEKAGVAAPGWASSAVWFDYDNDGRLDLFVCRFADYSQSKQQPCNHTGVAEYCVPRLYNPTPSWLFHNNGDGTFSDVSKESGIVGTLGKAWSAVATDINNDGRMDLFVSNDTAPNFLFVNRDGRHFDEVGLNAGVALSAEGKARSGMGVDSADFNQDCWMDLFVANIDQEVYSLYRNNRDGTFDDQGPHSDIGAATRLMSGWGLKFFDYDNDGNLDLFLANGHPDDLIGALNSSVSYREALLLFHNTGGGLKNVSPQGGPLFEQFLSARGLAIGDFDNDGAVDVLISVNDGAPVLLHNNVGALNNWLGLRLVGKKCNPDAIGARITWQAGGLKQSRMKVGGGSYLSAHDPRVVLGLGKQTQVDWLEIKWPLPSGRVQRFTRLPINRYVTIIEGSAMWQTA